MSAVKVDQSISSSYILSTRGSYQTGYPDGPTSNIEIAKSTTSRRKLYTHLCRSKSKWSIEIQKSFLDWFQTYYPGRVQSVLIFRNLW